MKMVDDERIKNAFSIQRFSQLKKIENFTRKFSQLKKNENFTRKISIFLTIMLKT